MDNEPSGPEVRAALLAAARFFADREVYGLVWINHDLIVRARFGSKADFVALGQPITDSVFPFIGSEDFIRSFQSDPAQSLELPGVVIVTSHNAQERYNLSLFWSAEQNSYLLLIARASLDATLEIELLRHVRARLMAEAETKAKSAELGRANADLENFAAIISHDLKAPMRALQFMTEEVETALAGSRIEEARTQVDWIRTQSKRMSSMLSGLLDYSSAGRKAQALEMVDTLELARAVAGSLARGTGIRVAVEGNWPMIETLKAPLDLVVRNLADNAIKHHDRAEGLVRLVGTDTADALQIAVADDGPGIAPEHRQAVFLPFRTLATGAGAETAGIGMGLALVQRTVESLGGTIELKPDVPGTRGSIFEVVWPKQLTL